MIEMSFFFPMIFFVRKRVLSVSHFIRRRSRLLCIICIYLFHFFFQDVLNRRLEERTDEMVERGLVDELCQFKTELSKMTGIDK